MFAKLAPLLLIALCQPSLAADQKSAALDATIRGIYSDISGPAGAARNWDLFRSRFVPKATLTPVFIGRNGSLRNVVISVDEYIKANDPYFAKHPFFEREAGRKTELYGDIAQVFSRYESRTDPKDRQPFERGVNSIQLAYDGTTWKVVSIMWEAESDKDRKPSKLPS